jgi:endonuclease/exonuclease/phosphatase family metal-dependent hydrolase
MEFRESKPSGEPCWKKKINIKLVAYNIQYTKGKDYRYDVDRIVQAIKGADVIALQEVERFWKRSKYYHLPE